MNFSFPPAGRGGPVFNFKSEGRRFDKDCASSEAHGLRLSRIAEGMTGTNCAMLLLSWAARFSRSMMPLIARKPRRGRMTLLARIRRRLQKTSPYGSLVLLLIPLLLVEPLKLVAVIVAGKGHWLTGTGMLVAAYAASLLVIERLFRVVKPKLMTIGWFAKLWSGFVALRAKLVS
jgi:hypothetical protein